MEASGTVSSSRLTGKLCPLQLAALALYLRYIDYLAQTLTGGHTEGERTQAVESQTYASYIFSNLGGENVSLMLDRFMEPSCYITDFDNHTTYLT